MKATASSHQYYDRQAAWIQPNLFPEVSEVLASPAPRKPQSWDQIYVQDLARHFMHQRSLAPEDHLEIWEDELTIGTAAHPN